MPAASTVPAPPTPAAATVNAPAAATHAIEAPAPRHPIKGLVVGGIVTLAAGYFISLVAGGVALAIDASQTPKYGGSCTAGAPAIFVPLVGPAIFAGEYPKHQLVAYGAGYPEAFDCNGSRSLEEGIVVADEILQLGGAVLLTSGLVFRRSDEPEAPQVGTIAIVPGTAATPLGLSMLIRGF
jgi:hypothetical protein